MASTSERPTLAIILVGFIFLAESSATIHTIRKLFGPGHVEADRLLATASAIMLGGAIVGVLSRAAWGWWLTLWAAGIYLLSFVASVVIPTVENPLSVLGVGCILCGALATTLNRQSTRRACLRDESHPLPNLGIAGTALLGTGLLLVVVDLRRILAELFS